MHRRREDHRQRGPVNADRCTTRARHLAQKPDHRLAEDSVCLASVHDRKPEPNDMFCRTRAPEAVLYLGANGHTKVHTVTCDLHLLSPKCASSAVVNSVMSRRPKYTNFVLRAFTACCVAQRTKAYEPMSASRASTTTRAAAAMT